MAAAAADPRLAAHRGAWQSKPALRAIYADYYRHIREHAREGRTLEIGGGSGHLRQYFEPVVLTDVLPAPWLDAVADAQALPFAHASFDNIVMLDVLHHVENPPLFFAEAARVLKPGGRLLMIEPAITPLAGWFYRRFHPEPVDLSQDPLAQAAPDPARDPFEANQAIPTRLFCRERARFAAAFPLLKLKAVRYFSLFAYPLSGGFRSWSLIPAVLVRPTLVLESLLMPMLGPLMAFRLFVVIERIAETRHSSALSIDSA